MRLKQLLDPKYFNIQLACLNHVDGVEFKSSNRHNYFLNELKKAGFTTYIIASKGQDVNADLKAIRKLLTGAMIISTLNVRGARTFLNL